MACSLIGQIRAALNQQAVTPPQSGVPSQSRPITAGVKPNPLRAHHGEAKARERGKEEQGV